MNLEQVRRFAFGALVLASFSAHAQQPATPPPSSPALSVNARLVNIPVVVRDKKGALIQNLTKDDFTLKVDNKPQVIKYFDRDTNLPLLLGLLVDTSYSQRNAIDEERTASSAFLDQMLTGAHDQAFVAQFAHQTELLQDLTSSHPLLQKALKEIDTPTRNTSSTDDTDSAGRRRPGGTTLYDALFLTSDEILSKQTGRKAIIILSDGADRNSKETLTRAIEAAQRADTVVYAIYFKGEEQNQDNNYPHHNRGGGGYPGGGYPGGGYPGGGYPGGGYPGGGYPGGGGNGGNRPTGGGASHIDGKRILDQIARETGGRVFEAKKNKDYAPIFQQIAEELRAQYRLGYIPTEDAAGVGYHQIDLTVPQKSLEVQTRDGYYAK